MEPVTHMLQRGLLNTGGRVIWTEVLLESREAGRDVREDGSTAKQSREKGERASKAFLHGFVLSFIRWPSTRTHMSRPGEDKSRMLIYEAPHLTPWLLQTAASLSLGSLSGNQQFTCIKVIPRLAWYSRAGWHEPHASLVNAYCFPEEGCKHVVKYCPEICVWLDFRYWIIYSGSLHVNILKSFLISYLGYI